MSPQRIQRRRTKGWRMPEGAVYVGRPSRWGNPFVVEKDVGGKLFPRMWGIYYCGQVLVRWDTKPLAMLDAVGRFRRFLREHPHLAENARKLAGKDLVCWCPLDQPCHADILLEIANGGAA